MKPFEKPIVRLNVKSVKAIYENFFSSDGVTQRWVHNIIEAHAPGNAEMKYTIVDRQHLIKGLGTQELSIRRLTDQEMTHLRAMPTTSSWYNPGMQVYTVQYPIDVKNYFKTCDWQKNLDLWVTESLNKDQRLVDSFMSNVIPLSGDPTLIQPLNAHAIWCTNTGAGKSHFAYLLGREPIIDPTEAGVIGSYNQGRYGFILKKGFLDGEGFPVILDEINTIDKPLIQKLLTYLETGRVTRGLKNPITIHGTKTVILNSNPETSDLVSSFATFIKVVCTADHPERVGRRFGFLLLGNDYIRVNDRGADSSLRDEVRRVIETVVHQYDREIQHMINDNMDWIKTPEPSIEKEISDYVKSIPNRIVSDFVKGQSYGCVKKLKMSAIRYLILEQLDGVPTGNVDFSAREDVFQRLMEINRDSYKKLASVQIPVNEDDKKRYVKELKAKHPNMSLRVIAKLVGVSHTTVKNWLEN